MRGHASLWDGPVDAQGLLQGWKLAERHMHMEYRTRCGVGYVITELYPKNNISRNN